jgi:hypothetical protein
MLAFIRCGDVIHTLYDAVRQEPDAPEPAVPQNEIDREGGPLRILNEKDA